MIRLCDDNDGKSEGGHRDVIMRLKDCRENKVPKGSIGETVYGCDGREIERHRTIANLVLRYRVIMFQPREKRYTGDLNGSLIRNKQLVASSLFGMVALPICGCENGPHTSRTASVAYLLSDVDPRHLPVP